MDEGHEPERIEIELTSHEPAASTGRSRRGPAGASSETTDPDHPGRSGLLGTERGRLVAVGAAAAVIALSVGVLVGRLGSGEVESSDDTSSATSAATTTTDPDRDVDTLPRAPDVLTPPPTTTVPSTVTSNTRPSASPAPTTDPERLVAGPISIHPDVPPDAVELVVLTADGEMVRIDVAGGRAVGTRAEGALTGPPEIRAGRGWVLVPVYDAARGSMVIFDDGSRSSLQLGSWWPTFTGTDGETLWRADIDQEIGAPIRLVGVTIDGSETGAIIELDGFYPHMTDPLGGVVVQAPGGHYVIRPDSRARITTGQLIALGERRALVNECDEVLACGHYVVDRATGARTQLILDPALGERSLIESGGYWSLREPMSPDEQALVVVTWDDSGGGRQVIGVLDLETGEHTEIGAFVDIPQTEWSADSRRVYWLDGGRLKVFDRSTGESVMFSDDLGRLVAMTQRPSTPSADESG